MVTTDNQNAASGSGYGFDARVAHPARVYDYWLGAYFRSLPVPDRFPSLFQAQA